MSSRSATRSRSSVMAENKSMAQDYIIKGNLSSKGAEHERGRQPVLRNPAATPLIVSRSARWIWAALGSFASIERERASSST